ncbi:MAG: Hsp20/alpha crystallin family protein [Acidimicrobiales bacterium]
MLMRFEPFREFDRVSEELFRQRSARQIPVDAYRRLTDLKIHLDLPGVDPGSIDLTVEKDVLTVVATRNWTPGEDDVVELRERAQGEFKRQLMLGESLDREHIAATYEDGVLTITIPVSEQAKPRKVEVTHAASVAQPIEAASAAA